MTKINEESKKRLYKAIISIENEAQCADFLEDLCTIQELESITQRIDVALELLEGKNYQEVNAATGASTATISRVSKCINYGNGGYKTVLSKIKK